MTDAITFKSYSQAGQDQWVYDTLVKPTSFIDGTFVDVGCGHPVDINNTYGLEQLGWRGVLMDVEQAKIDECVAAGRNKSVIVKADGSMFDWRTRLDWFTRMDFNRGQPARVCDYLSLDCDEATNSVLRQLLALAVRFRCVTVEHDAYRFGDRLRVEQRMWLNAAGYKLVKANVANAPGFEFEDWWCDPYTV